MRTAPAPPTCTPGALMDTAATPENVTRLLHAWQAGDGQAMDELSDLVYQQLRQIARRRLSRERDAHTLQPTALVNEAYVRLLEGGQMHWQDRAHFFATASLHMRAILVDHARARLAQKRGGDARQVTLEEGRIAGDGMHEADFLLLDEAMRELARHDPRSARMIELSYFSGLLREEIACVLGVSVPTVDRGLRFARAWLRSRLEPDPEPS